VAGAVGGAIAGQAFTTPQIKRNIVSVFGWVTVQFHSHSKQR